VSELPKEIFNLNIISEEVLPPPSELIRRVPVSKTAQNTVINGRQAVRDILDGKDNRLFIVVGPCSIHDLDSAREYAERLLKLSKKVEDNFLLVMRTYFEKPRTTVGWKGFINDPNLDDSFAIEEGLEKSRRFLVEINEMGIPAGKEALDPITPQYVGDLISWYAIGARTAESQTHREMASGLSSPVGFKNGTDGEVTTAVNALKSVSLGHHFLGISEETGQCAVFHTKGNKYGHVVLRGGGGKPNYDSVSVSICETALEEAGLKKNIMIDCSHGNSMKNYKLQPLVLTDCVNQIIDGNKSIVGMMLESHLFEGNQSIPNDKSQLKYGVSVTDSCIDWETTERILLEARDKLGGVLDKRKR
jgi:3-deoxy-7-phosphoheptulonate synthase